MVQIKKRECNQEVKMSRAKSLDLYLIEAPERMVTSAPWDWAVSTEIMLGTSPDIWGTQTLRLEDPSEFLKEK